eukprot:365059-Chlamydomonas_euryale.AAC.1
MNRGATGTRSLHLLRPCVQAGTREYCERWSNTPGTPGLCKYRWSLPQDYVLKAFSTFARNDVVGHSGRAAPTGMPRFIPCRMQTFLQR